MDKFVKEGKKVAKQYIDDHFENQDLVGMNSPCPDHDENNTKLFGWSESPVYFKVGDTNYTLSHSPGILYGDVYFLQKINFNNRNEFYCFESVVDEKRRVDGIQIQAVLSKKEYKDLVSRIK
jgi:hypothetical protein